MKKHKYLALLFLAACLLLFGCEKEPIASFTVSPTLLEVEHDVTFTNTSEDADHFEWFFGDNTSSTDKNPTHSYSEPGFYIVTLVAYTKSGRKMDDAYQAFITVVNPTRLILNVDMDGTPLNGCEVVLFNSYTNWYNNVNSVATATTGSLGSVVFTGCTNSIYYADFYHNGSRYGSIVTEALTLFTDNTYNVHFTNKQITFTNPTFTPITINVAGFASQTIPVGGSKTFNVTTNTIVLSASTSGIFSNGSPMALTIYWNSTITLSTSTTTVNLNIGNQYVFLYLSNNSGYVLGPIYSNYGLSSQVTVNASIPSDNIKYSLGYHNALSSTQFRAYVPSGGYYYWTNGAQFNFSGTINQSIWLGASKSVENFKAEKFNGVLLNQNQKLNPYFESKRMFKEVKGSIDLFPKSVN
jgi:PKD repeat protein